MRVAIVIFASFTVGCGARVLTCPDDSACDAESSSSDGAVETTGSVEPPDVTSAVTTSTGVPDPDDGSEVDSSGSGSASVGDETTTGPDPQVGFGDPSACLGAGDVLVFDGDADDWVHPGVLVLTDATWSPYQDAEPATELRLEITPNDPMQGLWWTVWIRTTAIPLELTPGVYEDTMRVPFRRPGPRWSRCDR